MSWRPKNFRDALVPFSTLYAIIGYGTFQYPIGRQRVLFSVVYAIIVTSIYWVLFALNMKRSIESPWFGEEEKIVYLIICVSFIIAAFAQFFNCYYHKEFLRVVDRMTRVDETLHELGVPFDYTKCMNMGIKMIAYWLVLVAIQNSIDVLWFLNRLPLNESIIIVTTRHHPVHINSIVSLSFCLFVWLIEMRLSIANKLLEDTLKPVNERATNDKSSKYLRIQVNETTLNASNVQPLKIDNQRKSLIQTIKHVHLELTLIAKDIEHFYGLMLLLEMAAYFVMFTGLFYTLYVMAINPKVEERLIRTIVVMTWNVVYFAKVIFINHMCERVTAEAKRTGNLIHCMNNNASEDSELPDEIRQFSLQLMSNPLCFSPFGFFTLGHDFLRGFLGSIVTYLVILIQMG